VLREEAAELREEAEVDVAEVEDKKKLIFFKLKRYL
jgi:hypothetical protein